MTYAEFAHKILRRTGFDLVRWPKRPDDFIMNWTIKLLLEKQGINCVLDVGANRGQFGQSLRSLGYRGRIVSFEPSPDSFQALSRLTSRDSRWQARQLALSAKSGTATLHTHPDSVFDSLHASLDSPDLPDLINGIPEFTDQGAATVTLSTLADEFEDSVAGIARPRVLLKSDTQGHDLDVLAGAQGLPPGVVAVLVELSAQPLYADQPYLTQVIDRLRDEDFIPVAFQPIARSLDELRVVEFDGLFMRRAPEGAERSPDADGLTQRDTSRAAG